MKLILDDLTTLGPYSLDRAPGEGRATLSHLCCVLPLMGKGQGADKKACEESGGGGLDLSHQGSLDAQVGHGFGSGGPEARQRVLVRGHCKTLSLAVPI